MSNASPLSSWGKARSSRTERSISKPDLTLLSEATKKNTSPNPSPRKVARTLVRMSSLRAAGIAILCIIMLFIMMARMSTLAEVGDGTLSISKETMVRKFVGEHFPQFEKGTANESSTLMDGNDQILENDPEMGNEDGGYVDMDADLPLSESEENNLTSSEEESNHTSTGVETNKQMTVLIRGKEMPIHPRVRYSRDVILVPPTNISQEVCLERAITTLSQDPCYQNNTKKFNLCSCSSMPRQFNYWLNWTSSSAKPITLNQIKNDMILIYIHINKAGGQTMKTAMFEGLNMESSDGAGFGTAAGWANLATFMDYWRRLKGFFRRELQVNGRNYVIQTLDDTASSKPSPVVINDKVAPYVNCGEVSQELTFENNHLSCQLRAIWGAHGLGLCELFPNRPCTYLLSLKDPVARAVSDYNYFCVLGKEKRKKWLPAWKKLNRCPVGIIKYFKTKVSSTRLLVDRMTRGCEGSCGLEVAKANLANPCVRYVILEDFDEDIKRFAHLLDGSAFGTAFANLLHRSEEERSRNTTPYAPRTIRQISNLAVMRELTQLVREDIILYEYAKSIRDMKAGQPLSSCNSLD